MRWRGAQLVISDAPPDSVGCWTNVGCQHAPSSTRKDLSMTISMFKASAPIFVQFLTSLSACLDKAAAHAEAKKIDPAVLLNTRLFPDMFPLRQVRAATDHAINACGRLA